MRDAKNMQQLFDNMQADVYRQVKDIMNAHFTALQERIEVAVMEERQAMEQEIAQVMGLNG